MMPHKSKERSREYHRAWYEGGGRELLARRKQERRLRDRERVLDHYGRLCACCGEDEPLFLTIDHVDGGGAQHRRELRLSSVELCAWLVKQGFPSGFQVLCFNCNCGRDRNGGVCPHHSKVGTV